MALTSFTSLFATEWPLSRMFRKLKLLSKSSPGYVICCLWTMPKPLTTWSVGRQTQVEPANSMASWGGAVKISQKSSRISSPCAARIQVCVTFRTKADKAIKSPLCVCVCVSNPNPQLHYRQSIFIATHTCILRETQLFSFRQSEMKKWSIPLSDNCKTTTSSLPVSPVRHRNDKRPPDRQPGGQESSF